MSSSPKRTCSGSRGETSSRRLATDSECCAIFPSASFAASTICWLSLRTICNGLMMAWELSSGRCAIWTLRLSSTLRLPTPCLPTSVDRRALATAAVFLVVVDTRVRASSVPVLYTATGSTEEACASLTLGTARMLFRPASDALFARATAAVFAVAM